MSKKINLIARRRLVSAFAMSPVVMAAAGAWAQTSYPDKPIRLVVPFAAGDPPDIAARALAERLSIILRQPVVIDNRAGAGGTLGAAEIAKSPADGYHLLYASAASMSIIPLLRKTPYDSTKNFVPIGTVTAINLALTVNKGFPAATWPEFVAEVKRNPRKYSFISSGEGSFVHLLGMQLQQAAGIELLHVPYRAYGQGIMDQVAGLADVSLDIGSSLPHVRTGALKALLVLDDKPLPELPGVPSLKDYPIPGLDARAWFGILAPSGIPKAISDRVQSAVAEVVSNDPTFSNKLPAGVRPMYLGGKDFAALMAKDRASYAAIIKRLNLKLE